MLPGGDIVDLSSDGMLFKEAAGPDLLRRVITVSEIYTEDDPIFPVTIAIRISGTVYFHFRNPREQFEKTESTIAAMVVAYDADEICILYSAEITGSLKAVSISCSRQCAGTAIVFELTSEDSRWAIGSPIVQMQSNVFGAHAGKHAVDFFNDNEERARVLEARKALEKWKPSYNWDFDDLIHLH